MKASPPPPPPPPTHTHTHTKKLYLSILSSDTWVAEYRKWMDRIRHGMPYHFGHNTISLPELHVAVVHAPAGLIAGASA
ncbi:hypothetical protein Peur_067689 [Populus x canadensis]